jgi:hypothetical protein
MHKEVKTCKQDENERLVKSFIEGYILCSTSFFVVALKARGGDEHNLAQRFLPQLGTEVLSEGSAG